MSFPAAGHNLVYAHGFRSSSLSRKAGELREYVRRHHPDLGIAVPDLAPDPVVALAQLEALCDACDPRRLTLVGSSLGGYYAWVLAEEYRVRAVLLNPSLRPFETLANHTGPQTNLYTGEPFGWTHAHLAALRSRRPAAVTQPSRYLVVVEMGDELLDHRETLTQFQGAEAIVEEGGDHDLRSFPRHLAAVVEFATRADGDIAEETVPAPV
ncbi:MAG: alpha/beta fold hydrolase [Betaproteobacteria bacterium]|nr:alpha/beta fold hydrolase [Betaproteobacteria bacterium]